MAAIGLSAEDLLDVVDAGTEANNAERGRLMLAEALRELPAERLDQLSLGRRDAWLLALRCGTFGDTLAARVICPRCARQLSVKVPRGHVDLQEPSTDPAPIRVHLREDTVTIEASAPDGAALALAALCADVDTARWALIASCIHSAHRDGKPIDPLTLDDALLERVGDAIIEAEPQVEVRIPMACAGCGHEWAPVLDIVQFLWRELSVTGVRLLDEVHELAVGYGWSEEQVLRIPSRRRRQYVERLASG